MTTKEDQFWETDLPILNTVCVNLKTSIFCTLQIEGLHQWKECPIEEVSYLRDLHRHIFHIKATKTVTHDNRDIEFIVLQHKIRKYLLSTYGVDGVCNFHNMSCEMIANELCSVFTLDECEVSEDGENGSIVKVNIITGE